jgi:iron only hydrogenase large subunit-like protein
MEACNEIGFCRLCVVEVEGKKDLVSSCDTEMENKMVIETKNERIESSRKSNLSLLSSRHRFDCFACPKDGECNFYDELKRHNVDYNDFNVSDGRHKGYILGAGISMDQSKCILCKKCVSVCNQFADAKVLKFRDDVAFDPIVSPTIGKDFTEAACTYCGMCLKACPTGTLYTTPSTSKLEELVASDDIVVVQVSKGATAFINEEFKRAPKDNYNATLSILDKIGIDYYVSNDLGNDLLIQAQADELKEHINNKEMLFTSDSPAWIRYIEMFQPDYLGNLSKLKSHHLIGANVIKEVYSKNLGVSKDKIKIVSLLPCTSAKYEIEREELLGQVDVVITASELGKFAKKRNIAFKAEKLRKMKALLDYSSNEMSALLPGVMKQLGLKPEFKLVKKFKLIEEATVTYQGQKINILKAVGNNAAKEMFKHFEQTKKHYSYVYVKGCFGDCLNGGGQPQTTRDFREVIADRKVLIKDVPIKDITDNKLIKDLYQEVKDEAYLKTTYSAKSFVRE